MIAPTCSTSCRISSIKGRVPYWEPGWEECSWRPRVCGRPWCSQPGQGSLLPRPQWAASVCCATTKPTAPPVATSPRPRSHISCSKIKGTVRQIGSAWEWYHWIGLEKPLWATSCKNEYILLLVWIMCTNRDLFRLTMLQKCGRDINCSLDYSSWGKNSNVPQSKPKYVEQRFGEFFHKENVRQPIGRQDSMQTGSEQAGGWIHFCMNRLRTSFQIFKREIKKLKNLAVDVFFKAYPMVPLSCRYNLVGRYLYTTL